MKAFADLYTALDETTSTQAKVDALADYFRTASGPDKVWTIALLSSRRPKRAVSVTRLREWAAQAAGIPLWLFEESYAIVGDLAETIALVLPSPGRQTNKGLSEWLALVESLRGQAEDDQRQAILNAWQELDTVGRLLFNKLMTGGFRVGVSQKLMTRGLAIATGRAEDDLAHALMGDWSPSEIGFDELFQGGEGLSAQSRPYPFCLAHPLEEDVGSLGEIGEWLAEWKWDGIRGQIVVRGGMQFLWSRGEELITDRFPEFAAFADLLPPGTVIDGEVLGWKDGAVLPFQMLQTRIGRKTVSKRQLAEAPAILMAYDLLELAGEDCRSLPLAERRARLEMLLAGLSGNALPIRLSPSVQATDWEGLAEVRAQSRQVGAEGLMLKRMTSPYAVGRKRGDWWKWKVDPMSIDCVMIYAQQGHGRRANLFTDFTFAVPGADGQLVAFAKAYSGLTDAEFAEITQWVKKNTIQRFGPVRSVPAVQVFELAFEGIQRSTRHKSGIALRFPRIRRWRKDKPVSEINTLADLQSILELHKETAIS